MYQLGALFAGGGFTVWTGIAIVALIGLLYLLLRKNKYDTNTLRMKAAYAEK